MMPLGRWLAAGAAALMAVVVGIWQWSAAPEPQPWKTEVVKKFYNRNELVPNIKRTILVATDHIHVITGPRSSGKSTLVLVVLNDERLVVHVDCRALTTSDKNTFVQGFKETFNTAARRARSTLSSVTTAASYASEPLAGAASSTVGELMEKWALERRGWDQMPAKAAGGAAAKVAEKAIENMIDALIGVFKSDDPLRELDAAINTIYQNEGKLVIFLDELNALQSKGKAKHEWKDEFTQDLMRILIRNTKQLGKANVIIATSDQQYAALMKGKADFRMHCLGYMGIEEIDEFLKIDWEGDPAVEKEEDRQKIIDSNGGFFPGLAELRRAAKDGYLDETIEQMQLETNRGLKSRLSGIPAEKRPACKSALQSISKNLADRGYAAYDDLVDAVGEDVVEPLVVQNLMQLRYAETGHKGELWAPDLPEAARSIDVVMPYLPIDRKWLREL